MAVVDLLLLHCAFLASFYIRFGSDVQTRLVNLHAYAEIFPLLSACTVLIVHVSGLYANWIRKSKPFLVHSAGTASGMIVLAAVVLSFWKHAVAVPRVIFPLAFAILAVLLAGSRLLGQYLHRLHLGGRRVLVIARDIETAFTLMRKFNAEAGWYRVDKVLTFDHLACLPSLLSEVDTVAIDELMEDKSHLVSMSAQAGKEILLVPGVGELLLFSSRTQQMDDLLLLSVAPLTLSSSQKAIKCAIDLAASGLIFVLVSPLLLLVYFVIRLDSPGPAIYKQERVGQNGKLFYMFKFRTMKFDAERYSGPVLACEKDPRITRIGRFLRASRVDELPQLLNVILGEMSFVGPRPERLFFVEQFTAETPDYHLRFNVKPGITGLAQIWGRYSTRMEDKLRLDLIYMANYSPMLDLKIIIQTLGVVVLRENAEGIVKSSEVKLPRIIPDHQLTPFSDSRRLGNAD